MDKKRRALAALAAVGLDPRRASHVGHLALRDFEEREYGKAERPPLRMSGGISISTSRLHAISQLKGASLPTYKLED